MYSAVSKEYSLFLSQYPLTDYPDGHILLQPNDDLSSIFYLSSGKVRKYDVTKYGEQVVMNVFNAPLLFPLSWVLNKTPNRYYFAALGPVSVRVVPVDALQAYLKKDPGLVYDLLQRVYFGLENTQRRVVYLTRGTVRTRLLFELLVEAERSGVVQADNTVLITTSETELAQRAGLSRETISRELTKLIKAGNVCTRQGRSLVIKDMRELDEVLRKLT